MPKRRLSVEVLKGFTWQAGRPHPGLNDDPYFFVLFIFHSINTNRKFNFVTIDLVSILFYYLLSFLRERHAVVFPWYWLVMSKILISNGIANVLIKKNVSGHSRTKRFLLQFIFCALITGFISVVTGKFNFSYAAGLVFIVGFFNGLAAYCQWEAIKVSLSKNSLFTFWDDIIAMSLAYFILNEGATLTPILIVGISISLLSVILFVLNDYKKRVQQEKDKTNLPLSFLVYVGIYSLIWGVAVFLMKYFSLKGVGFFTFLPSWYAGASVAAVLIRLKMRASESTDPAFTAKDILGVLVLSVTIFTGLGLAFLSYGAAPLIVAQPLFLVGEMIVPALIGLYFFKEIKELDYRQKIFFGMGILGGTIISFSFG